MPEALGGIVLFQWVFFLHYVPFYVANWLVGTSYLLYIASSSTSYHTYIMAIGST